MGRIDALTARHGWGQEIRQGTAFRHKVIFNGVHGEQDRLHVYIEGDGSPYLDRWTVASDPTPRRPVMLDLMALDRAPSVYIGRPCYLGLAGDTGCAPTAWTLDRYSEHTVASMTRVIELLQIERGATAIELYGHSGGGSLAVLIAPRLQGVSRVVTLGGNLDIDAWASYHGYAPLTGSLNPVRQGRLPEDVEQLHLAGSADRTVPDWLIGRSAPQLGDGDVRVLQGVTHTAGWRDHWSAVLEESAASTPPQSRTLP